MPVDLSHASMLSLFDNVNVTKSFQKVIGPNLRKLYSTPHDFGGPDMARLFDTVELLRRTTVHHPQTHPSPRHTRPNSIRREGTVESPKKRNPSLPFATVYAIRKGRESKTRKLVPSPTSSASSSSFQQTYLFVLTLSSCATIFTVCVLTSERKNPIKAKRK